MAGMKGQAVEVQVLRSTGIEDSLGDVVSFDTEDKLEIKEQGYLGETTNRHDDVYNGTTGSMTMHMQKAKAMQFRMDLIERARRRTPWFKVNLKASFNYDNGDVFRVSFPDVKFGTPKVSAGARADYVTLTFNWACDAPRKLGA